MNTTLRIVSFEVGFYIRRISTWVYFAMFFALGALLAATLGGAFEGVNLAMGGAGGRVLANSPYTITIIISVLSLFAVLVTAALAGNAGQRDFGAGIFPLIFTTPVTKHQLLAGRFLGTLLLNLLVQLGIGLGYGLGGLAPGLDAASFGPFALWPYLQAYGLFIIPNILLTAALFFSLAALTRKILPNYLGGVLLLIGYLLSGQLARGLESRWIGALLDPFGTRAFQLATQYWTPLEKNTDAVSLSGLILYNRLLWLLVGSLLLLVTFSRFRFSQHRGRRRRRAGPPPTSPAPRADEDGPLAAPAARGQFTGRTGLRQYLTLARQAFFDVVRSPYFYAILVAGLVFLIPAGQQVGRMYGTYTWPVTGHVLEVLGGTFSLFVLIIITFYTGDLVWRERDLRISQLIDAAPVPSWIVYAAKLTALTLIVVVLLAVILIAGMTTQELKGYSNHEVGLYLSTLYGFFLIDYLLICVLALAVHTLINHKYLGHLVMVLYYILSVLLPLLGLDHNLYRFGSDAGMTYSDMNGYGPYLAPFFWFKAYWVAFALMLAVLSNLLWVRGGERGWRRRLRLARAGATRAAAAIAALGLAAFLGLGGFIYYNTNILNRRVTGRETERLQVDYERRYKKYETLPQPRITGVALAVDIYPARRDLVVKGTYQLRNKTGRTIDALHLRVPPEMKVRRLTPGRPHTLAVQDDRRTYRIYHLNEALAPGGAMSLRFELELRGDGFPNQVKRMEHTAVVENGTFLHSPRIAVGIGYDPQFELQSARRRAKLGLPPRRRMPKISDRAARRRNYISGDADWIDFEATISTAADQIAIAPGTLQRQWTAGGRRHFHYRMARPILGFYSLLSARYAVRRDRWRGVDIAVYHHRDHTYNVDRMIEAVKKSLAYFTANFGPYQHRLLRIVEFPRYGQFAQSFPNTIPYSEALGFIARVGPNDVDTPFYVTAHEVAHQWWAHQVIGANVQGATFLSESMAQYSAMMVMEKEYGPHQLRKFLAHELDRYLRGRSVERRKERPLRLVENQQYIHYNRGALAMYRLRDTVGEARVNRALARYIARVKHQEPPYTTSDDLLAALRKETPPEYRYLLTDLFETITLHENRTVSARRRRLAGERHEVTLELSIRKIRADGDGKERDVPVHDHIDVAVMGEGDKVLYLKKHLFRSRRQVIRVAVDGRPVRAGIDPYLKIVDRHADDNMIPVEDG